MNPRKKPIRIPAEKKAEDILEKFVRIFAGKGWLDQTLRIKYRDRKYRLYCSETVFAAYRINDYRRSSHGFPGWPVCFVTPEQIIEDTDMTKFATAEPSVHDWLRFIADEDLELI